MPINDHVWYKGKRFEVISDDHNTVDVYYGHAKESRTFYKMSLDPHVVLRGTGQLRFIRDLRKDYTDDLIVQALLDKIERLSFHHIPEPYSCVECPSRTEENTCSIHFHKDLPPKLLALPFWCPKHSKPVLEVKGIAYSTMNKFITYCNDNYNGVIGYVEQGPQTDISYVILTVGGNVDAIKQGFFRYFETHSYTIIV
jgi:hypothetical protein